MLMTLLFSIALTVGQFFVSAPSAQTMNTIEGRITGSTGHPLGDLRVLLKNGNFADVASTLTDTSGRFRFLNLGRDNYYIIVEPGATDYERVTQRIAVMPFREGHGEVFRIDIGLVPRKSSNSLFGPVNSADAVVFYQNVPEAAKKERSEEHT